MDMKPLKVRISLTLDPDVVEEIRRLADEDDRTLSQYINLVLKERIARKSTSRENTER